MTEKSENTGSTPSGTIKHKVWKDLKFWDSIVWHDIQEKLRTEQLQVRPDPKYLFRPLIETPLHKVRVMVIGSEPSSTMDVDGLAYSYPRECTDTNLLPNALENIFVEYQRDTGYPQPRTGSLLPWARKGVLLWNDCPTVKASYPYSHAGFGWHKLTQEIIDTLYLQNKNTIFAFWGVHQQHYIDTLPTDALVLDCGSPSLVMANKGFFGSAPFTKINSMLIGKGSPPVDWRLP